MRQNYRQWQTDFKMRAVKDTKKEGEISAFDQILKDIIDKFAQEKTQAVH